ncbi:SWIM zinc finger family protein [Pantoea sp. R13S299]|uniref:SWIM zinc finger family protein n=1 Tax=Pantoea sp. R13S299 TaxID=3402751 RepID=UPI003AE7EA9F
MLPPERVHPAPASCSLPVQSRCSCPRFSGSRRLCRHNPAGSLPSQDRAHGKFR